MGFMEQDAVPVTQLAVSEFIFCLNLSVKPGFKPKFGLKPNLIIFNKPDTIPVPQQTVSKHITGSC